MKWIIYQLWQLGFFKKKFNVLEKEDRIDIYKKIIVHIDYDVSKNLKTHGLCYYFRYVTHDRLKTFPEIFYVRPYINKGDLFWWKRFDYQARIKALEKAIKLAKNSKR